MFFRRRDSSTKEDRTLHSVPARDANPSTGSEESTASTVGRKRRQSLFSSFASIRQSYESPAEIKIHPSTFKSETSEYVTPTRLPQLRTKQFSIGDTVIGGSASTLIVSLERIESAEQLLSLGMTLEKAMERGISARFLRLPALPVQSGLLNGQNVKLLRTIARRFGLSIIGHVIEASDIHELSKHCEMLEIQAPQLADRPLLLGLASANRALLVHRPADFSLTAFLEALFTLERHGQPNIVVVERGTPSGYDEQPLLDIPMMLDVMRHTPYPVLVDCTAMSKNWTYVESIACAATSVGAHGAIVDVASDLLATGHGVDNAFLPEHFVAVAGRIQAVRATRCAMEIQSHCNCIEPN
jgi:3-deoxy-7-phosphoheptulonate synthase